MMVRKCVPAPSRRGRGRAGTIVTMLALCMVAICGFMALAIDVGMLTVAKAQAQNAADMAALTAARTLNGNSSASTYNNAAATTNAQAIVSYNTILSQPIQASQLTLTYGSYDYNQTTQVFTANYPPTAGVAWTAAAATVTSNNLPGAFSRIFGSQFLPNVTCVATAVHRPRDIAMVMDLSGSMRFGTCLGFDFYTTSRTSNNPDTVVPAFGAYSSGSAVMIGPSTAQTSGASSYTITPSNTTVGNASYPLTYINSFYQNAAYATPLVRAFDSYTSTDGGNTWTAPTSGAPQLPPASYATTPGGDVPLFKSGSTTTYAQSVNDVLGTTGSPGTVNPLWCLDGYSAYVNGQKDTSGTGGVPKVWLQPDYSATPFNGYTQGPGYYGKTFFQWPPDPRNASALLTTATLTAYLTLIGVNAADVATLTSNWPTWTAQGVGPGSTGLANLKAWLTSKGYTTTTGPWVPNSGSKAPVYYAVCRLFNWAYPGGSSWTGTTLQSGTSFSADWRMRFFGTTSNTVLFNAGGSLNPPGSAGMTLTATQTYNAILNWLTATGPNPFPTQMRSGRIKYYGSIPTSITGAWPSYGSTDQRFWVEFIDHALGFNQTAAGVYLDLSGINSQYPMIGYGKDFAWGTVAVNAVPTLPQYMNYTDNPARPLLRHWFSPILMVDVLHNMNMLENASPYGAGLNLNFFVKQPGNSYEAPLYTAKQAFVSAVTTMQNNHPNDWFTMASYSQPRASAGDAQGRMNCVSVPLGTNYNYASSSLLFPFSTINADGSCNNTEVTPYDPDPVTGAVPSANFQDINRGNSDTCFAMGLMLAYNQFALTPVTDTTLRKFVSNSPIAFPTGTAGGLGRKGAQKVVIFETDGIPNCMATANLVSGGSYNYYKIRDDMNNPTGSEYPSVSPLGINDPNVLNQIYTLIQQMGTTYSTTRNPFRLYAIGFGPVFSGPLASQGLSTLQTMQYYAGTQSSASTPLSPTQIITGTGVQMSTNMTTAFTSILDNGVQIALIQ